MGTDIPDWKPGMPRVLGEMSLKDTLTVEAISLIAMMPPTDLLRWIEQGRAIVAGRKPSPPRVADASDCPE